MKKLLIFLLLLFPAPAYAEEPEETEVISVEQAVSEPAEPDEDVEEEIEPVAAAATTHGHSLPRLSVPVHTQPWVGTLSRNQVHHKSRRHHKRYAKRH